MKFFIPPILKKKWFWISLVVAFIVAFLFDTVVAFSVMTKSLTSGRWELPLLLTGVSYALIFSLKVFVSKTYKKKAVTLTRLLWFTCLVWAITHYGYFIGLYFIASITILSRFLSFGVKLMVSYYKRRQVTIQRTAHS